MMSWYAQVTILGILLLVGTGWPQGSPAAEPAPLATRVRERLNEQDAWLGRGKNADHWRLYLLETKLREQLAKPAEADPVALADVLGRYSSGLQGLENPRFTRVRKALAAWLAELPQTPLVDLARSIGEGEGLFVATSPEMVERRRQHLQAMVAKLDAYLTPGKENGARWKKYLDWDNLTAQAAPGSTPDTSRLSALARLFQAGYQGLEMKVFSDVGQALQSYFDAAAAARLPDQQADFASSRKLFRERLEKYLANPNGEDYDDMAEAAGYFERRGYAPALLARLRRHFSRPNLVVRVSQRMVSTAMAERVNEQTPVTDNILGTSISGTGHTVGEVNFELVPHDDYAELMAVFTGTVRSRTVGVNGPAIIHSAGLTQFVTRQPIFLNAFGLATTSASAEATVRTQTLCIGSSKRLGGNLVRRIASKRVAESKGQSEWIAARHAETRLERNFGERLGLRVDEADVVFVDRFRSPLARRNAGPAVLDFRSTQGALWVDWLQLGPGHLAAASAAPAPRNDADISARVHESMLNNLTLSAIGGLTLDDQELERLLKDIYGEVPRQFAREEGEAPWSITFARRRPVSVRFEDGVLAVTIRGSRFTSGESAYEAMNISTSYKVEQSEGRTELVRQGDIEVFPPDFKEGDRLSVKQTSLRRLLVKRFSKIFEPRYDLTKLELTGKLGTSGDLGVLEFALDDGWLSASFVLQPKPRVTSSGSVAVLP